VLAINTVFRTPLIFFTTLVRTRTVRSSLPAQRVLVSPEQDNFTLATPLLATFTSAPILTVPLRGPVGLAVAVNENVPELACSALAPP